MFNVRSALTPGAVQGGRIFWRRLVAKQPGWADAHSQGDGGVDRQRPQSVWSPQRDHRHCPTQTRKPWSHWMRSASHHIGQYLGADLRRLRWGGDWKAVIALNKVSIHHIGAIFGGRLGEIKGGDWKAVIALNKVSIHHIGAIFGGRLGEIKGGGGLESRDCTERGQRPPNWAIFGGRLAEIKVGGETGKPWLHWTRSASTTLGNIWGQTWGD